LQPVRVGPRATQQPLRGRGARGSACNRDGAPQLGRRGASLVSAGGVGFGLPALRPDDNYVLFDVGASGEIGNSRITGFVSVNFTASKNDDNYQAITVGIRAPL
jgi:hypothetical protein